MIFDRFKQVDKSFSRSQEGSGIGLSIVKSLIDIHGGTIDVESTLGKGTKFIIKLPVKKVEESFPTKDNEIEVHNNNYVERIRIEFSDIYKLPYR